MSELKEYIDRKLRLAKLDSALLFFSSSLSLAFGVGYAYLGTEWLRYYLPMLFLGWFMPIYIGYIRGSLIRDSIEERVRGWTYFVIGLGYYAFSPLLSTTVKRTFAEGILTTVFIAIPTFLFGFFHARVQSKLIREIFRIRKENLKVKQLQAFKATRNSAFFLAVALSVASIFDFSNSKIESNIVIIAMLIVYLFLVISFEREAREFLSNQ